MANLEATYSSDFHAVFVETSLETRIAILAYEIESISDFRDKFCKEHKQTYPEVGEIDISALKVKRQGLFYHLSDFMSMGKAFEGICHENWFLYVDAARVDKGEPVAAGQKDEDSKGSDGTKRQIRRYQTAGAIVEDSDENNMSMGENEKDSDADMLCQEHTRDEVKDVEADQTPKEALETDESQKSCGKEPSVKLDDLTGAIEQDVGTGDKSAGLVEIDQEEELEVCSQVQVGVAPQLCDTLPREKIESLAPRIASIFQTGENQLEASSSTTIGRPEKKSSKDDMNQSIDSASRKIVTEINRVPENAMGKKSVEDVETDNIETDNLASDASNQLEDNTGLTICPVSEKKKKKKKRSKDQSIDATTEKKGRRKKSSKDHINHPTASAVATGSLEIENESKKVSDDVDADN